MSDPHARQLWTDVLESAHARVRELRADPAKLRATIAKPVMFDPGDGAVGNPRVAGILTLLSWSGLVFGGFAALVAALFTTGPLLWVAVAVAVLSLLYVIYEGRRERRYAGPWYEECRVLAGCLLIANDDLYEPGDSLLPGGMLVTFDDALASDPQRLLGLVDELKGYYRDQRDTPLEMREAVAWIESDIVTPSFTRIRLPQSFSGNANSWLVCMGMDQTAMPNRCLDRALWPVFGREGRNEPVVLLPHGLWHRSDERLDALMRGDSA